MPDTLCLLTDSCVCHKPLMIGGSVTAGELVNCYHFVILHYLLCLSENILYCRPINCIKLMNISLYFCTKVHV